MSTIEQLLDSAHVRIPASEPERRLMERNVERREIFANPSRLDPVARMIMAAGSLMAEHERPVDRVAENVGSVDGRTNSRAPVLTCACVTRAHAAAHGRHLEVNPCCDAFPFACGPSPRRGWRWSLARPDRAIRTAGERAVPNRRRCGLCRARRPLSRFTAQRLRCPEGGL
jgi:hypothetical protein